MCRRAVAVFQALADEVAETVDTAERVGAVVVVLALRGRQADAELACGAGWAVDTFTGVAGHALEAQAAVLSRTVRVRAALALEDAPPLQARLPWVAVAVVEARGLEHTLTLDAAVQRAAVLVRTALAHEDAAPLGATLGRPAVHVVGALGRLALAARTDLTPRAVAIDLAARRLALEVHAALTSRALPVRPALRGVHAAAPVARHPGAALAIPLALRWRTHAAFADRPLGAHPVGPAGSGHACASVEGATLPRGTVVVVVAVRGRLAYAPLGVALPAPGAVPVVAALTLRPAPMLKAEGARAAVVVVAALAWDAARVLTQLVGAALPVAGALVGEDAAPLHACEVVRTLLRGSAAFHAAAVFADRASAAVVIATTLRTPPRDA